jgi:hypothetical protein
VEPRLHVSDPFDDLLSLADVDAALTGAGLRRPAVRVVRDGVGVDPARWTRTARTGATVLDDVIDAPRLLELYADGCTIVLQSMQRWWPPVTRLCRQLEAVLTHAVQANAYLTPPGAAGLAPHHDTHDVFVLQLHGTKHWTVRAPTIEAPLEHHRSTTQRAAEQPVLFDLELSPGMCLYLPRGAVHSALAQETSSLHLTVGVLATTAYDVVRRLTTLAGDLPSLRRSLPPGWARDPEVARAAVEQALTDLAGVVEGADTSAIADHLTTRYLLSRQPYLDGQLLELEALATIDDDAVVRRRGVVATAAVVAGRLQISVGSRTIDLPAAVELAVDRLLGPDPVRVGDLDDLLDGGSRLVLVRRLVREGLLRHIGADG